MPENTIYVGRPTKWGNPFQIPHNSSKQFKKIMIEKFRQSMSTMLKEDAVNELKGKNLACWCSLDEPCHADVLIEIANSTKEEEYAELIMQCQNVQAAIFYLREYASQFKN